MPKPLVLIALGTRPEAVKLAPVHRALESAGATRAEILLTGQHRELLAPVLKDLGLRPAADLKLMRRGQELNELFARAVSGVGAALRRRRPDLVVVQGDTTTAFAAALAAFHERVPVAHVEAGLRTFDHDNPFPEELNRAAVDQLAALLFAPTQRAARNLRGPGAGRVLVTGNTVVDALRWALEQRRPPADAALRRALAAAAPGDAFALATAHRRESQERHLPGLCRAFAEIAERQPRLRILFPVHPSARVRAAARLAAHPRVHLLPPLGYLDAVEALRRSRFVMTDSGGLVEEAAVLGRPTLILRRVTERPEAVEAGVATVAGVEPATVVRWASRLMDDEALYKKMARPAKVFGDGRASERIARACAEFLGS